MKSWSYTVGNPFGPKEAIEALTEQAAKNKLFQLHGIKRIYIVSGQWGVTTEREEDQRE